jgi:hypothetical protein
LNILNFSHNYYKLLDKFKNKDVINVSIIDRINLNYKDINGKTLLYCACQRGDLKLIKQLIKLGGNPTISDDNGFTPLMAAVTRNFTQIVRYLLKLPSIINGINYVDEKSKTAIEYANEYKRYYCVRELLTVQGLDHIILNRLLSEYSAIKSNDDQYIGYHSIINEIKNTIKKYLKIPIITKASIKKLQIPSSLSEKIPIPYKKTPIEKNNESGMLNVDIDRNPDLLDQIYRPIEPSRFSVPQTSEYELSELRNFDKREFDLIYQAPTKS